MRSSSGNEVTFCGITVRPLTIPELNESVARAVDGDRTVIVANHNLHSLYLFHREPLLREFFSRADLAHIDGMSLVFLARCFGFRLSRDQRVTYVDWIAPLMAEAERSSWRVFFLGGKPGVAERGAAALHGQFPRLRLSVRHGYFDMRQQGRENDRVVAEINSHAPDLLLVGMGMPRQEQWILENQQRLSAKVILPAGACFDYLAGAVPTPPRWMGRVGLEWCYRLLSEPGRLWRRYLCEPLLLSPLVLREMMARRFFPGEEGEA